jgi:nicotinamidase-related amidase
MDNSTLPLPDHYRPEQTDQIWRVEYQTRAADAATWRQQHQLQSAGTDAFRIGLLLVDVQNTFCIPGFELFVGGRSGTGAVDDNQRLAAFIYRNLHHITTIAPTMDTHQAVQIFHSIFLVDDRGQHPPPYTLVSAADVEAGRWRFNPDVAVGLGITIADGQAFLHHYTQTLAEQNKYNLTVWPYHAMLGGIGHALVPAIEEAIFFHSICRFARPDIQVKGDNPLTENYSVLRPEVIRGPTGEKVGAKNTNLIQTLLAYDALIITGQAQSHCVTWTIDDLLAEIEATDARLARKVYLMEDCTSAVVIPGVIDYTDAADAAFERFSQAGMHRVRSTDPIASWPGMPTPSSDPLPPR